MIARRAWPMLLTIVALVGCRAAGFNNGLAPEPIEPKAPSQAVEIIDRANANAAKVSSLESPATVNLNGRMTAVVHGDMALERPRNFRMVLGSLSRSTEADVGSNGDEFWFWSARDKDKAVYVCEYGEGGEAPLAAAMQPDWIIEAMGLRTVPPEEAAQATVRAGAAGEVVLTIRRRGAQAGETLIKESVYSSTTGRAKEHRLLSSKGEGPPVLLANATIKSFQSLGGAPAEDDADVSVTLPNWIVLAWYEPRKARPHLQMEVKLTKLVLNPKFNEERRTSLFTEPEAPPGYARRNLRDNTPLAVEGPATRKSRSIPPSPSASRPGFVEDNGVELGDPMPDTSDAPATSAPRAIPSAKPAPKPLDDLPPLSDARSHAPEAVIGARLPTAALGF